MTSNAQDKTSVFMTMVKQHKSRIGHLIPQNTVPNLTVIGDSEMKKFNAKAVSISDSLAIVSERLQKLSSSVQDRSYFSDSSTQISRLTEDIKHDMLKISLSIETISQETQSNTSQSTKLMENMVSDLKVRFSQISKRFTEILEHRTNLLKENYDRQKLFSTGGNEVRQRSKFKNFNKGNKPGMGSNDGNSENIGLLQNNALDRMTGVNTSGSNAGLDNMTGYMNSNIDTDVDVNFTSLLSQQFDSSQQQDYNSIYTRERVQAVEEVASTIEEVSRMYMQMNEMLNIQEEMVLRIDADIDDIEINVEAGNTELVKYLNNLSSNQWLIIKILVIIIIFAIFFVTIIA